MICGPEFKMATLKVSSMLEAGKREMLEIWTKKQVKATRHRVIRGNRERFSIPFFFNPQYDTVISNEPKILAGDYLSARYDETYVHKMA